jgi:ABC-type oligopeptide transport system ATPase subunit
MNDAAGPLVRAANLSVRFPLRGGGWRRSRDWVRAVDGVDLEIARGEVVGLVGESGSGKSTLGRTLLRLVEPNEGRVLFDGTDLADLSRRELRALRPRMQLVFQDPYASLNPRMSVFQILSEPLLVHGLASRRELRDRVAELLQAVRMEPYFMQRYPHEFSGGQRQRIAIARALSTEPDFLVADEPVSALDVSVQAQVLDVLAELQQRRNIAMLFISHDLSVVERVADRIAVMFGGRIVEEGSPSAIIRSPRDPYTRQLLDAVPRIP